MLQQTAEQQHIILQTTCTQNEGSKMIVLSSYSLSIYIPTAQACPSTPNNKSLLLLLFSILLQHEPSYLSDAAEIQDIVEALSYRDLFLLKLFCLQNYLTLLSNYSLLFFFLISLLPICSIFLHSVLSSTLPPKIVSLPPTDF